MASTLGGTGARRVRLLLLKGLGGGRREHGLRLLTFIFEADSGQAPHKGLLQQPGELVGGLRQVEAGGADIRDAVALGIQSSDLRLPGQVEAHAVGGGQPRTFADHHQYGSAV